LILHGWGGSSDSWIEVAKKLTDNFYVIVLDIPCASKLTDCDKVYTLDDYAKLVKDFIDELELENFILMGHSN
jgi:pimeloyl-ACP methyl ester carboxylesterase